MKSQVTYFCRGKMKPLFLKSKIKHSIFLHEPLYDAQCCSRPVVVHSGHVFIKSIPIAFILEYLHIYKNYAVLIWPLMRLWMTKNINIQSRCITWQNSEILLADCLSYVTTWQCVCLFIVIECHRHELMNEWGPSQQK